jgi:hypothetical protein
MECRRLLLGGKGRERVWKDVIDEKARTSV